MRSWKRSVRRIEKIGSEKQKQNERIGQENNVVFVTHLMRWNIEWESYDFHSCTASFNPQLARMRFFSNENVVKVQICFSVNLSYSDLPLFKSLSLIVVVFLSSSLSIMSFCHRHCCCLSDLLSSSSSILSSMGVQTCVKQ